MPSRQPKKAPVKTDDVSTSNQKEVMWIVKFVGGIAMAIFTGERCAFEGGRAESS